MNSPVEAYIRLNVGDLGAPSYVRRDRLRLLRAVDAIIFDCDGVLIDIRDSYNRAISETVAYLFESLTGHTFTESLISDEIIFSFRKSGGFNNDWDQTYGILMYILCNMPPSLRDSLRQAIVPTRQDTDPYEVFLSVKRTMIQKAFRRPLNDDLLNSLADDLLEFSEDLDETGIMSVDRNLSGDERLRGFYSEVKRFLSYPGDVGESMIATIFEEFFCGPGLFRETFKAEPRFYVEGPGLIENEQLIIRSETLDHLASSLERAKFGISSGSGVKQAEYILGSLLERFDPRALIFREVVERAMREAAERGDSSVSLWKPNPFSLFGAAGALEPFAYVLYVGDSMEDAMMVDKTGERGERFLFAGVYYYSATREETLNLFFEAGCDLILPSVNELPLVLDWVRRRRD